MTYCVALLLDGGLVFASDTRTNAGVDQVAVFPKMHVFEVKGERVLTLLTAGNLGITQSVINRLREAVRANEDRHLQNVSSLFEAAELVGAEMRRAYERDAEHLKNHNAEFNAARRSALTAAWNTMAAPPTTANAANPRNSINPIAPSPASSVPQL